MEKTTKNMRRAPVKRTGATGPSRGGTTILIGGEPVSAISFTGDPQRQLDRRIKTADRSQQGHIPVFDGPFGDTLRDSGYTVESLLSGGPSKPGQNGTTPHIGANGNWYIGETDTGVPARGEDGVPGKSAYQSYLDAGGTLSEAEWVASFIDDTKLVPYATKEWTQQKIDEATGHVDEQVDLMPTRSTTHTGNGITFTPIDGGAGGYRISGTATALTAYAIYKDGMPDGVIAGNRYILDANTDYNMLITVTTTNGEGVLNIIYNSETSTSNEFTIPADTSQVAFRASVRAGATMDMVFLPHLYAAPEMQYPAPMLTIVDDDGYAKFETLLLPVIIEKKAPIASAVIGQNVGESFAMSVESIKNCALGGAEIVSHSWEHLTEAKAADMEQYAIQYDYQKMKNFLAVHGVNTDCLIFCGNSATVAKCRNAAEMVYGYALNPGANKVNQKYSTARYNIARFGIDAGSNLTGEHLQGLLDDLAAAGTGWMVWTIHTSSNLFQQAEADIIAAMIDYARSKGIEVVTTAYGVEKYVVD